MSKIEPTDAFRVDSLRVEVYPSNQELGRAAARFTAETLLRAVDSGGNANLILATGSSQFAFLESLQDDRSIRWDRITVFHLDEYCGMSPEHPASFRRYLRKRILDDVRPARVHFLEGDAADLESEVTRYEMLLNSHPIHMACIGIGENGHLAFNDPPVAAFQDSRLVKVVRLDDMCRRQQLGEGWFPSLDEVPTEALTLTIPAIMRSRCISCVVPEERKAKAVAHCLEGPITTKCPASILRRHSNARLFLDRDSASQLTRSSAHRSGSVSRLRTPDRSRK